MTSFVKDLSQQEWYSFVKKAEMKRRNDNYK